MDDVDVIIQQHFTVILVKAAVIRHGLLQTVGAINIDQRAQRDPGKSRRALTWLR